MLRLTRRDVRHECEWVEESAFPFHLLRTRIRLPSSGVTCSVLILGVFHSLFSRDSGIFTLSFGGSQSFPPTQIYLPKAVSEHPGWKSLEARPKSKGQWMCHGLEEAAGWLWNTSWALEHFCPKLEDPSLATTTSSGLCVSWTIVKGWKMWLLIYTTQCRWKNVKQNGALKDHLNQIQFPKKESGSQRSEVTCLELYSESVTSFSSKPEGINQNSDFCDSLFLDNSP